MHENEVVEEVCRQTVFERANFRRGADVVSGPEAEAFGKHLRSVEVCFVDDLVGGVHASLTSTKYVCLRWKHKDS